LNLSTKGTRCYSSSTYRVVEAFRVDACRGGVAGLAAGNALSDGGSARHRLRLAGNPIGPTGWLRDALSASSVVDLVLVRPEVARERSVVGLVGALMRIGVARAVAEVALVRAGPRCDIAVGWRLLASGSARSLRHRGPVFAGERYVAAVELVAGVGDVAPRFSAPREVLAVEADGSAERLAVTGRLGLGRAVRRRAGPCSESEQHQQGDGPPHLVVRGAATVSAAQKAGSKQRQEPTQYNRACRLVRFDF
jgi:hypothetical protein